MVEFRKKLSQIINYLESVTAKNLTLDIEQAKNKIREEQISAMYTPKLKELSNG